MQRATCNLRRVTRNLQRATCSIILLLIGLAGCGRQDQISLGAGATTTTTLPPPQAQLVLGQTVFSKNAVNLVDAAGMSLPHSVAVDRSVIPNRFYVADTLNHRILRYSDVSALANGSPADIVIGQPDLLSNFCNGPATIVVASGTSTGGNSNSALMNTGTLNDTNQSFTINQLTNFVVEITGGTGAGQTRAIIANTATQLKVSPPWTTIPDNTSTYQIMEAGEPNSRTLCGPRSVAVDGAGNLYVADTQNHRVLIYAAPITTGMAASVVLGQSGFNTRTDNEGGSAGPRSLSAPEGVAADSAGNVYVADTINNRVLEYDAPVSSGMAASRVFGQADLFSNLCNQGGASVSATTLCGPRGIALDSADNLYIADTLNNRVLEYNTPLSTDFAADHAFGQFDDPTTNECNLFGFVSEFGLCGPQGVAVDGLDNLYVADTDNNRVLEFDMPITDFFADYVFGQADFSSNGSNSSGISADSLSLPTGVALDASGNLYVGDTDNNRVLQYNPPFNAPAPNTAAVVLGQSAFTTNGLNFVDAVGLKRPKAVAIDRSVIPHRLYIADTENNRVLGYSDISALIDGSPADLVIGQDDMNSNLCDKGNTDSDGLPVVDGTTLCGPRGVAVDSAGNLYVADSGNNRVLEYDTPFSGTPPGPGDAIADQVFGQGNSFTTIATGISTNPTVNANICNNALALGVKGLSDKSLCLPAGVVLDSSGNLYVADTGNNRILEYDTPLAITLSGTSTGGNSNDVTTHTGTLNDNTQTFTSDQFVNFIVEITGGVAGGQIRTIVSNSAQQLVVTPMWQTIPPINAPYRIRVGTVADRVFGQGDVFNTNSCNSTTAVVGGLGSKSLCFPEGIALDNAGDLYVADTFNNRVLEYDAPIASDTTADRFFGQPNFISNAINANNLGEPSPPSADSLFLPRGVAVGSAGDLYVADTRNSRVLKYLTPLSSDQVADLVFGQPDFTSSLCNNLAAAIGGVSDKSLCFPEGIALDSADSLYVADTKNHRVLRFP